MSHSSTRTLWLLVGLLAVAPATPARAQEDPPDAPGQTPPTIGNPAPLVTLAHKTDPQHGQPRDGEFVVTLATNESIGTITTAAVLRRGDFQPRWFVTNAQAQTIDVSVLSPGVHVVRLTTSEGFVLYSKLFEVAGTGQSFPPNSIPVANFAVRLEDTREAPDMLALGESVDLVASKVTDRDRVFSYPDLVPTWTTGNGFDGLPPSGNLGTVSPTTGFRTTVTAGASSGGRTRLLDVIAGVPSQLTPPQAGYGGGTQFWVIPLQGASANDVVGVEMTLDGRTLGSEEFLHVAPDVRTTPFRSFAVLRDGRRVAVPVQWRLAVENDPPGHTLEPLDPTPPEGVSDSAGDLLAVSQGDEVVFVAGGFFEQYTLILRAILAESATSPEGVTFLTNIHFRLCYELSEHGDFPNYVVQPMNPVVLRPGEQVDLGAFTTDGSRELAAAWRLEPDDGSLGTIDPLTGAYTAPDVAAVGTIVVVVPFCEADGRKEIPLTIQSLAGPTVTLIAPTSPVLEGSRTTFGLRFTTVFGDPLQEDLTVLVVGSTDVALVTTSYTFLAGESPRTVQLELDAVDDPLLEDRFEATSISIQSLGDPDATAGGPAEVVVEDTDRAFVRLTAPSSPVPEGQTGQVVVRLELTPGTAPLPSPLVVHLASDAPIDLNAAGTVTFPADATTGAELHASATGVTDLRFEARFETIAVRIVQVTPSFGEAGPDVGVQVEDADQATLAFAPSATTLQVPSPTTTAHVASVTLVLASGVVFDAPSLVVSVQAAGSSFYAVATPVFTFSAPGSQPYAGQVMPNAPPGTVVLSLIPLPADPRLTVSGHVLTLSVLPPTVPARSGPVNVPGFVVDDNDSPATTGTGDCTVLHHSGENRISRTDLALRGRGGAQFVLQRRYLSRIEWETPLGHGWDSDLFEKLVVDPTTGHVDRVRLGRVDRWSRLTDTTFSNPPGFFGTLRRRVDGTYALRETDGRKTFYSSDGVLLRREDPTGNHLTFEHDAAGRLTRVLDAFHQPIVFEYTGARLTKVRDYAGREVVYGYSAAGDLETARAPVVSGTSTGDDFPAGRTERYTYTSGFADARLNHNLVSITRPPEVASGGPAYYSWTYHEDPADAFLCDRVATQTLGGTNSSGVPAGGTYIFTYEQLTGTGPDAAAVRTTVEDRAGNVVVHEANDRGEELLERVLTRGLREDDPTAFETRSRWREGLLVSRTYPEGNELRITYGSGSRAAQKDPVEVRLVAGPRGGGADLVTTMTYEPLRRQLLSVTDPRGNDAAFAPPLGAQSAERYTTRFFYDYQEGTGAVPDAAEFGVDLSGVARGLGDLNGDGRTDQVQGNQVRVAAPPVKLRSDSLEAARLGSTTQAVLTETVWNAHGQPTTVVDAEGQVTEFLFSSAADPDQDGASHAVAPVSSSATGWLVGAKADARTSPRRRTAAAPLALESRVGYDAVGHVVRTRDPRGVVTRLEVNALGEAVKVVRGDDVTEAVASGQLVTGESAFRFETKLFHDANGQVVRVEEENRGETTPGVGPFVVRRVERDILGRPVEVRAKIDAATEAVTQLRWDANENLSLVVRPDGQRLKTVHDERDLPFQVTRGEDTPQASTVELTYTPNGLRKTLKDAEDSDGDGQREVTAWAYDGFNRLTQATDALRGQALFAYDPASNVVRQVFMGHPAAAPSNPLVLLQDTRLEHDELGRIYQVHTALFLGGALAPTRPVVLSDHDGDGLVTSRFEHDALGRTYAVVEDDLEVTRTVFDGASRVLETVDALGNKRTFERDRNGNPTSVTSLEVSPEGLVPAESFATRYVWDQLGRLARVSDNAGHTTRLTWDSRDHLIGRTDPMGAVIADPLGVVPGTINGPGNVVTFVVDGLGRVTEESHELRAGGLGTGPLDTTNPANPDGKVTVRYTWSPGSRLASVADDKGQTTSFTYDALDRKTRHTYADGTFATYEFGKDDELKKVTDPNGSVVTRTFDALHRVKQVDVARGAGVQGTTRETYAFDGLSRVVRETDDNGGLATHTVERTFDSRGLALEERQDGRVVSRTYTGDAKRTSLTYPGGRVLGYAHDAVDRVKRITDGTGPGAPLVAEYSWIGPGSRVLQRRHGNGTALTLLDDLGRADAGYDAVQRVVRLRHVGVTGQAIVDRVHAYDRASNRLSEQRLDDQGLTDAYTYDSAYRVVTSSFDQGGATGAAGRSLVSAAYTYDGAGNRVERREGQRTRPVALHGDERVDLSHRALVEGDVVADGQDRCPGHGRRRCGCRHARRSDVDVGPEARVTGDVTGRQVTLRARARVDGDVSTDRLVRQSSATVGGALVPFAAPEPIPDVEPVPFGQGEVVVRPNQAALLLPGRYGTVRVQRGGRLILQGGTYELAELRVGPQAVVEVRAAAVVRVACRLELDARSCVLLAAGLGAADLRWESLDRATSIGPEALFVGVLIAPDGDVHLHQGTQVNGQVLAERVRAGPNVVVRAPPGQARQVTTGYATNSLNQYTHVGGVAQGHDKNGNLTDDGRRRLVWDYRGRLVSVSDKVTGVGVATYTYDCGNRRVTKTAGTRTTRWLWDGWDLIEEQNVSGQTEVTYVSGVGVDEHLQVARTNAHPAGAAVLWCHQDARGSVVAVTNASGAVVERTRFDDFGRPDAVGSVPHGFQGRYRDAETGWVYFRNRVYDPETGRFLSRDPVWDPANVGNLYTFVGNGPISGRDPLGLEPEDPAEGAAPKRDDPTKAAEALNSREMRDKQWRRFEEGNNWKKMYPRAKSKDQARAFFAKEMSMQEASDWGGDFSPDKRHALNDQHRAQTGDIPRREAFESDGRPVEVKPRRGSTIDLNRIRRDAKRGRKGGALTEVLVVGAVIAVGVATQMDRSPVCVALETVVPRAYDKAINRGSADYWPEAGMDAVTTVDPTGVTAGGEDFIDYFTEDKPASMWEGVKRVWRGTTNPVFHPGEVPGGVAEFWGGVAQQGRRWWRD